MSVTEFVWVAISVALASFAQSLSGFGFALLSVPVMALIVDPRDAVVISTFLGAVSTTTQAILDRAHRDWPMAKRLVLASYVGMPLGLGVFIVVSETALRIVLGVVVIGAAVTLARGFRLREGTHAFDWSLGILSGVLATSTSTNGPPLVFLMQARNLDARVFRSTLNTVFAFANIGAIALFLAAGKVHAGSLLGVLVALPALGVALTLGYRIRRHVHGDRFRNLVLALLVLSGISVLVGALGR